MLKWPLTEWQLGMQEQNGWNAIFRKQSAKMLATCIHMLRGTPYIYQGEELGMTNPGYRTIEEYRNVESTNYYKILLQKGKKKQGAMDILQRRSRDSARSPLQWNKTAYAGFASHAPWIGVPESYRYINVETE